jgi:hypothetical protein
VRGQRAGDVQISADAPADNEKAAAHDVTESATCVRPATPIVPHHEMPAAIPQLSSHLSGMPWCTIELMLAFR